LKSATASCVGFVPTLIGDPASSANPLLSAFVQQHADGAQRKAGGDEVDAAVAVEVGGGDGVG